MSPPGAHTVQSGVAGTGISAVLAQINRIILGKDDQIRLCLACLLAKGPLLI
jgi:MoxR-like ATPase